MKILYQNLKLPVCGTETIAYAQDVFSYIDSDFKRWNLNNPGETRTAEEVAVLEIDKDGTFQEIFSRINGDMDAMCLSQAQILAFVKEHRDKLRTDGWSTFFLLKDKKEFFVAVVFFGDDGQLKVGVYRLSFGGVWFAEGGHRIVVQQLALKHSELK